MRLMAMLAGITGTLVLALACSDGAGIPPLENKAPVAMFTVPPCTIDMACHFTSSSTDDEQVTKWSWDFDGDGGADANTADASFTYKTAKDFDVSLTVYDAQGLNHTKISTITIAPLPPGNPAPTAAFTHACNAVDCTFFSTSTDAAPGTIATYAWAFGDGAAADVSNPSHRFNVTALTAFTVTLTVTDNEGATAVATQTVTVDPAPPVNNPPTASFSYACAAAACTFISTARDPEGSPIATFAWTFGDGAEAVGNNPAHTYTISAVTEFTVTLTVTDNQGATAVASQTITVNPDPSVNIPPTASFTPWCYGEGCIFLNNSTDPSPGAIVTYAWTYGDGGTSSRNTPCFPWTGLCGVGRHVYSVTGRTTFTVTLTVTDNEGAVAVATRRVTVTPLPPAVQGCTTSGRIVECVLDIPARSSLVVTVLGVSCDLVQKVSTPPPVGDQLFISVCNNKVGDSTGIFAGNDEGRWLYEAGTQARIWFHQDDADHALNPAEGRLEGTFPNWTISYEDGDHPDAPGEPDFADLVLGIQATLR
jgi:large repetitive protein